ncbi:MAG: UbiD family decarboxylase [Candidatus Korobacteraceae bacterium]|jgi:4-hydroxy-3-polyprenylbenzoate decarboxylase
MAEVIIRDLRDWLNEVEKIGQLKRVGQEVDPKLEMGALTYMNGKNPGHPTLLFEKPKGHNGPFKVLFNPIGNSIDRLSLAMRAKPGRKPLELVEYLKDIFASDKKMIPPKFVDAKDAPIYENEWTGNKIDMTSLPTPMHWPRDGGDYIGTADAIITKDPESGRVNLGTYRQMVEGKARVGYYSSPGKDTLLDREKWWAKGEPCPVVSVYGLDPLLFICAATGFPKMDSEYDYAGGINGAPIEVVKGKVTGLPIPARAEVVIEGFAYPNQGQAEGPFGEFTGYYGRPGHEQTPYIEVKAVYFRNNPTMTAALMADTPGCNEQSLFLGMLRGVRIWSDLESCGIPGIKGVWGPPEAAGGFGMTVVSMKQMYAGHAQQAAAIAAQCAGGAYYSKFIYIVDEDIDPSNLEEVIWAASTRCRCSDDIDILRNTWSTYLDPSKNPNSDRPWGSKALIYACKEQKNIDKFALRTALTKEQYAHAVARWQELGMHGVPPSLRFFDDLTVKAAAAGK